LPRSGYVQAVHIGKRTQEEAQVFLQKIKSCSDGQAPLFLSDAWFYEAPIFETYSTYEAVPYSGRGRPRKPIRVVNEALKYAQVYKKRDSKGNIIEMQTRIIKGEESEILKIIQETSRGATQINTCHDAHTYFLTAVLNFCRENRGLRQVINPNAGLFEQKYARISPAMKEGLSDKILSVKELLAWRPKKNIP